MEELKKYILAELVIDGKGSYGIGAPAVDFDSHKYTYLRITDINDDGSINYAGLKSVEDTDACRYLLKENDIVFARTGNSTGRTYFYETSDGELVYAGFLIKFSLDYRKVNPRILKYYTHSMEYYDWVKSFDTGGTRGNINAQTYANMPIELPDRKTQDKIVDILSALDDKIALNKRINDNLEQQAQYIYEELFANEDISQLTELGNVIETTSGGTPSRLSVSFYRAGNINWVKSKELKGTFLINTEELITDVAVKKSSAKLLPQNSVLIAMYGATVGEYAIISKQMTCNQAICALQPNANYPYTFLFIFAKNKKDELVNKAVGSAQQNISQILIKQLLISQNIKVIKKYDNLTRPLFEEMKDNIIENERLSALRDSLLPKLMSGELKINNI